MAYVDNMRCKQGTRTGSRMSPFCEISEAVAQLGDKKVIRVEGSMAPYHGVTTAGTLAPVRIVGPGRSAQPPATLTDNVTILRSHVSAAHAPTRGGAPWATRSEEPRSRTRSEDVLHVRPPHRQGTLGTSAPRPGSRKGDTRASRERHRSPLLLACVEDYLAGKRYPLDVIHTHASVYGLGGQP